MLQKISFSCIRLAFVWPLVMALPAVAATSFSNSLTGFTGDSTQPATQTALAAAGFNVSNSVDSTPAVSFDSAGAHFGSFGGGNDSRNYLRTNGSDYATTSFVAEVTMVVPNFDVAPYQSPWLGMGAADISSSFFGWPDVYTPNSSVGVVAEKFGDPPNVSQFYTTFVNHNEDASFFNNSAPALTAGLVNGTHRMRLSSFNELAVFSIDLNYAGGAFVDDYKAPAINVSALFGSDGWPTEPSRIYFGGDDGAVFKDFQVTVSGAQGKFADLNSDNSVNSLDWNILRTNLESDLNSLGLTVKNAYARGDLNLDNLVNYADFNIFQDAYDVANGAGSFANLLGAVPEPSTLILFLLASPFVLPTRRRPTDHV